MASLWSNVLIVTYWIFFSKIIWTKQQCSASSHWIKWLCCVSRWGIFYNVSGKLCYFYKAEKRNSFDGVGKPTNTFRILPVYMLYQSQESSGSVVCKLLDDQGSVCARDKNFFSLLLICTGSGADYLAPCFWG